MPWTVEFTISVVKHSFLHWGQFHLLFANIVINYLISSRVHDRRLLWLEGYLKVVILLIWPLEASSTNLRNTYGKFFFNSAQQIGAVSFDANHFWGTLCQSKSACLSTLNKLSKWLNELEQIIPILGTAPMNIISSKKTYGHCVQEKDFGLKRFL